MSDAASPILSASQRAPEERARFIELAYVHVAGAIALFALASWLLARVGFGVWALKLVSAHWWSWLAVLVAYGAAGAMCSALAQARAAPAQYAGLAAAAFIEAMIFAPLLALVYARSGAGAIQSAIIGTLVLVGGLTAIVRISGRDFSWMGVYLKLIGMLALGLIVSSILFGFSLGILFSYAMLAFAAACVVYDTSRILNEHTQDNYVSAALELFGSIALVFWYMLQIFGAGEDSSEDAAPDAASDQTAAPAPASDATSAAASVTDVAVSGAAALAETTGEAASVAASAVETTANVAEAAISGVDALAAGGEAIASVAEAVASSAEAAEVATEVASGIGGFIVGLITD